MSCGCIDKPNWARDRNISVGKTQRILAASIPADSVQYRVIITSDQDIDIEYVHRSTVGNPYTVRSGCAENSATEYQGIGQLDIFVSGFSTNTKDASVTISIETQKRYYEQSYLFSDIAQQSLNGALVLAGSNKGKPQPFCNRMRVYADQNLRIQGKDTKTGIYVYLSGIQTVDEVTFVDLHAPHDMIWEIRQSTADPIIPMNFKCIWFKQY